MHEFLFIFLNFFLNYYVNVASSLANHDSILILWNATQRKDRVMCPDELDLFEGLDWKDE